MKAYIALQMNIGYRVQSHYGITWLSHCFRVLTLAIVLIALLACDAKRDHAEDWNSRNQVQTNAYNYISHEIRHISLQDAAEQFDLRKAAPGGSTLFEGLGGTDLGPGVRVYSSEGLCCFDWRYGVDAPVTLQVKWLAVYDRQTYLEAERDMDDRAMRGALPGSAWCQAKVVVSRPYPKKPGRLSVHFLPDGTLKVHISAAGSLDKEGPLTVDEVLSHPQSANTLPCPATSSNPWYMVPRKKHTE
jgi:hypothetical protein